MKISILLVLTCLLASSLAFRARSQVQLETGVQFTPHQNCGSGHPGPDNCAAVADLLAIPAYLTTAFGLCDDNMGNNGGESEVNYGANYGCLCCEACHSPVFTANGFANPCAS